MQADAEDRKGTEQRELRICEIYASLQGEGLLTGTPSVFIRTSGCNLRCWFCDTPFASWRPEGEYLSVAEIASQSTSLGCEHIVITGGEPMIYAALVELTEQLHQSNYHITIETAGTLSLPVKCDLMSISPKLSSSAPGQEAGSWRQTHNQRRERMPIVRELMRDYAYQLKFVVDTVADAAEALDYVHRLETAGEVTVERDRVLLMPQGIDQAALDKQAEWLLPWCQDHGLSFCQRSHIAWFGNQRGT